MAAYEGDDSEEAKAKIQELKVSLEEAKDDLQETEYDKFISDQEKLLDNLYTEYELILNERLDNIDTLISNSIEAINTNAVSIGSTISNAADTVGLTLSTEMEKVWGLNNTNNVVQEVGKCLTELGLSKENQKLILDALGAGDTRTANSVIQKLIDNGTISSEDGQRIKSVIQEQLTGKNGVLSTYDGYFADGETSLIKTLGGIKTTVDNMAEKSDEEAEEKIESPQTSPSVEENPSTGEPPKTQPSTSESEAPKSEVPKSEVPKTTSDDGVPKVGDKVKFLSGKYYYDSQGKNPAGSKYQGKEVYITHINTKKWATHPYHISTGKKLGSGDLGWLKLNQISGYATGKKNFLDNELAWTQEQGQEYIVRPSDGAILTPVAKGDSVLNARASSNIWKMANSPAEFIKDNLNFSAANIPNNANVQSSYVQNLENVVFSFPNVKNYDEMLAAMQKDPNFDRLIASMSIGKLAGGSSLAKGKAIR